MKLEQAQIVAADIIAYLMPACVRIEVAGSVRRRKPQVKDIEILFIPKTFNPQPTLFETDVNLQTVLATDVILGDLLARGIIVKDEKVKRWGPKYKRVVHVQTGIVLELFTAEQENWGYAYALKTGPAEFNHVMVTQRKFGGALPNNMTARNGYIWRDGTKCPTPTEEIFFREIGLPYWPPEQRSAATLKAYLAGRQRQHLEFTPVYEGKLDPRHQY
jgi:DNA polymerase/3'-5' exonuclease PolX